MPTAGKNALAIDILIESDGWPPRGALTRLTRRAVAAAAAEAGIELPSGTELSLLFADDARLRELNSAYRNKDMPTNVLSFPGPPAGSGPGNHMLGDIVLARETIAREAGAGGLTMTEHLAHLIVHGFLHLCGYDHETDDQALVMEGLESRILGKLGIEDPYAQGPTGTSPTGKPAEGNDRR